MQYVDHVDHGDDEIHLGIAAEQLRHVLGQINGGIVASHQVREAGNRRSQGINHRHDRVGDIVDHVHDRPEELAEKGADIKVDVAEPGTQLLVKQAVVTAGKERVDALLDCTLVAALPGQMKVALDGRQVTHAARRDAQHHVQVDLGLRFPADIDQIRQVGTAYVRIGKATVGQIAQGVDAKQTPILQVNRKLTVQVGSRPFLSGLTAEHFGGTAVIRSACSMGQRVGASAPNAGVVILDPAIVIVGQRAVKNQELGAEGGRRAASPRREEHVDTELDFFDLVRLAGLADQPQVTDVLVINVVLDRGGGIDRTVGIEVGDLANAGIAGHIGDEIETVLDVQPKAEKEIPGQVELNAAVEL